MGTGCTVPSTSDTQSMSGSSPTLMMFSLAAAWFISRYQLDRAGHASALATLGRAGSAEPS